ncbi:MAG: glycerophosphodiester phosphodiesterase family protein [Acidobacteriota bacterium]|nr:glycerophosphodiester phosphodiesterase family protein [Acidobacteriota bacterium]
MITERSIDVVGLFFLIQTGILVAAARATGVVHESKGIETATGGDAPNPNLGIAVITGVVIAGVALSIWSYGALKPGTEWDTEVLAHRGFVSGGVENTISALVAARDADADLVEMDVQQTKDGGWVVLHDPRLKRLADQDVAIYDLTTEQATAIVVTDGTHSDHIPTLEAYLEKAAAIGQQLLIEIKVHGHESPGYVSELLALIDRVDHAGDHIYHTLSADVVKQFRDLRPDLTIGYIVPLSVGGVPDSPADFLVVEQGTYSTKLRDSVWARGQSLFVWTVQDPEEMRVLFRDGVDGIITDHPDLALQERKQVSDEKGVADRLSDALKRLRVTP